MDDVGLASESRDQFHVSIVLSGTAAPQIDIFFFPVDMDGVRFEPHGRFLDVFHHGVGDDHAGRFAGNYVLLAVMLSHEVDGRSGDYRVAWCVPGEFIEHTFFDGALIEARIFDLMR